jgi:hypothetical protein
MTEDNPGTSPAQDPLNSQIVAAVALVNATAANGSPAVARAALEQMIAHSANLAMLNAVAAQQNAYVSANAVVVATIDRVLRARETRGAP